MLASTVNLAYTLETPQFDEEEHRALERALKGSGGGSRKKKEKKTKTKTTT